MNRSLGIAGLLLATTACAQVNWIDVDGVKVFEPPREHPRLYLRARDLPDLQRRMEHPVTKPVWAQLQTGAKASMQMRVEVDALRYLLNHDEALGKRAVADALSLMQRTSGGEGENSSRAIGRMMVTGAIVYDWAYPLVSTGLGTGDVPLQADVGGATTPASVVISLQERG